MGVFTESAVHLRDEIAALRHARAACRQELERTTQARRLEVSNLLGAFAGDLEGVRRAWSGSTPTPAPPAKLGNQPMPADTAPAQPVKLEKQPMRMDAAPAQPVKPEMQPRRMDAAPTGTGEHLRAKPPEPAPKSHPKKHKKH